MESARVACGWSRNFSTRTFKHTFADFIAMKEIDQESIESRIQDINAKLCTVELRPVLPLAICEDPSVPRTNLRPSPLVLVTSRVGSLAREGTAMNWTTILTEEARNNCIVRTDHYVQLGPWRKRGIPLRTRPHLWASWSMWVAIESISIAPVRGALRSLSLARVFLSIGDLSNPKSRDLLRCVRMTTQESVGANPVRKTHAPSGLARYTPH